MPHHLLRTIRDEHHSLTVMIHALQMVIHRGPGQAPGRYFEIVRTMLVYVKEFSEHVHHPKEAQLVFPRVMQVAQDTVHAVAGIEQAYRLNVAELDPLQILLTAWQIGDVQQRHAFEREALRFCDDYLAQIRLEEVSIIPVADQLVTEAQWDRLAKRYHPPAAPEAGFVPADSGYELMYNRIALWLTRFLTPSVPLHR